MIDESQQQLRGLWEARMLALTGYKADAVMAGGRALRDYGVYGSDGFGAPQRRWATVAVLAALDWLEANGFAVVEVGPRCRLCGCSELEACPGGCWWVPDPDGPGVVCSACVGIAVDDDEDEDPRWWRGIEDVPVAGERL